MFYVGGVQVQTGTPCANGGYGGAPLSHGGPSSPGTSSYLPEAPPFLIGARVDARTTHGQNELTSDTGHAEFMGDIEQVQQLPFRLLSKPKT